MENLRYIYRLTPVKFAYANKRFTNRSIKQFMFRQLSSLDSYRNFRHVKDIIRLSLRNNQLLEQILNVRLALKSQSTNLLKSWMYQCECVVAQRLRRGQQMFCLYSRLWDEYRLKEFLKQIQQHTTIRTRDILFASLGIGVYDWKTNRISDKEILDHQFDIEYVYLLKKKTTCNYPEDKSCQLKMYDKWTVFIEKDDLIVWRRLDKSGHFEYKVYGRYNDVTAEDFLNVQVDTKYRKKWDTTAVKLDVIESEPNTNSDIIYWEMLWPKLFANRDYVFNRRYLVEIDTKTIFVLNKSTEHPACPKKSSTFRIKDYWSVMVIKPFTEFDQLGIEFSLTYYDNPGVNIPATVTTWVAMKAMPDFLARLREASKQYKAYCSQEGVTCYYDVSKLTSKDANKDEVEEKPGWEIFDIDDVIIDNTIFEVIINKSKLRKQKQTKGEPPSKIDCKEPINPNCSEKEQTNEPPPVNHSFWRYLHPMYYFS